MCGITGFWSHTKLDEDPVEVLNRMGDTLAHRGPDDSGTFYEESSGLGFAFRRLSIIDLSMEGHQPMASPSGRYIIVFNGEVYNFNEIRAELGAVQWRGHSDTEVLLGAIECWGLEASVKRFVGMFAFALWDCHRKRLYLVRDRIGIKPLFYGYVDGNFVFASELKAIRAFPGFAAAIDRNNLALFMRFSCIPAPHSVYEGIFKLQPGHILELTALGAKPLISAYWSAVDVARDGLGLQVRTQSGDAEVIEQLHQKLLDAVRLRMHADVPLGAFLSGGIDSSTVVALMQCQSGRPVKTFTIGFLEDDHNEAAYASQIAKHLGTDHTELYLTPQDALGVVPLLPAMFDEPFADSSQIPTYLVSKLARHHVTVCLSGDGGDELFGGYPRYALTDALVKVLRRIPGPVARAGTKFVHAIPPDRIDQILGWLPMPSALKPSPGHKFHKLAGLAKLDPGSIYLQALSQWTDPESVVLGAAEPATVTRDIAELEWMPEVLERAMLTDLTHYLPDDILTKVDRASMAVGLEARVPLLDHRVVEFAWTLPRRFKMRQRRAKWILRQVLYRYVPPAMVERPKMGFSVPIDRWLRGPLREWAESLLSPESLRRGGYLAVAPIRKAWDEFLTQSRNWQHQLWAVLMFQSWLAENPASAQSLNDHRHLSIAVRSL